MENKSQCMIMALVKITCLSFLFSSLLVSPLTTLWLLNPLCVQSKFYLQLTALNSRSFVLYHFLVRFQTSAMPTPGYPCGCPFAPFSIVFFVKLLVGSGQFDRLSWLPRAFYHLFVLQKPCSFLKWIREFYSFWIWYYRLGYLSRFAVMLITFLFLSLGSASVPVLQVWGFCKWHLWTRAWIFLIWRLWRCQVALFYPGFICEISLV